MQHTPTAVLRFYRSKFSTDWRKGRSKRNDTAHSLEVNLAHVHSINLQTRFARERSNFVLTHFCNTNTIVTSNTTLTIIRFYSDRCSWISSAKWQAREVKRDARRSSKKLETFIVNVSLLYYYICSLIMTNVS